MTRMMPFSTSSGLAPGIRYPNGHAVLRELGKHFLLDLCGHEDPAGQQDDHQQVRRDAVMDHPRDRAAGSDSTMAQAERGCSLLCPFRPARLAGLLEPKWHAFDRSRNVGDDDPIV
jgi:hypothetical protein